MRMLQLMMMLALGTLTQLLTADAAYAAQVVQPAVTGAVTALPGGEQIVVDGRRYMVAFNSGLLDQVRTLHVGDVVQLYLDGPVSSSLSKVISINVQPKSK